VESSQTKPRKKEALKMNMTISAIGLPWYEASTFGQCMALMADRQRLFQSYETWLQAALITERNCKAEGKTVVRAIIEPEAFKAWCAHHRPGLDINAEARIQFASMVAKNHAVDH